MAGIANLMRRFQRLETGCLNLIRVFLTAAVPLAVLALAGAGLRWGFALLTAESPQAEHYLTAPDWAAIRSSVLPLAAPEPAATVQAPTPGSQGDGALRQLADERIARIANDLNAQFQRNSGAQTAFTDRYPRRLLEQWILQDSGLPQAHLPAYVDALAALAKEIGQDPRINRIASVDDRARTIMQALEAFRRAFLKQSEAAAALAAQASQAEADRREAAGRQSLLLGLGGMAALLLLAPTVALLRIEHRLRGASLEQR